MLSLNFPNKLTYFKSEKLSSVETLRKIVNVVDSVCSLIGCNIFSSENLLKNPMLIVLLVDLVVYLSVSFQNIYAFRDDFVRDIFCVVTLGMGFQGAIKLYTFIWHQEKILDLLAKAEKFHEKSNDKKVYESFEKWTLISCHAGIFFAIMFYGCALLIFVYPFIVRLFTGSWILHFGFIIPGIDWQTLHGYLLNFAFHTFEIYVVTNALVSSTIFTVILMINAFAQYDALEFLLDDLSELAVVRNFNDEKDEQIKICIRNIVNGHDDLIE
jgi:odorant receptor